VGDVDPALRSEAAHTTASAVLHRGRAGAEDPALVARLVALVDEEGLDTIATLWAQSPPDTLPGALWRLYLLREWVRRDPRTVAERFRLGVVRAEVSGVVAGVAIAHEVFAYFDPNLTVTDYIADGSEVKPGDVVFDVTGRIQSLLQTERLMLNIMQRMSGIATTTRRYVKALEGTGTRVLDTRKTTPGMRLLEKEAVRLGGGVNHRVGLYDMILLKDNHVDFAGGIRQAIERANAYLKAHNKQLDIEIEVRSLEELEIVLQTGGIQRIMLDNFDLATTRKAVERIGGRYETESSGGITFDTLRSYAECGVDFISVGALTHSVKSLDISFKAV